jgi:hypothetical protein
MVSGLAGEAALPAPGTSSRRRWVTWIAVLLLVGLIALVLLHPALRDLAADTWRKMRSISPLSLGLIFLFKIGQSLFSSLSWRNALAAAWPNAPLAYRFVLGVEQGQVAMNTVLPARAGTWAMLGIFGLSIRGARAPKLLAVWGVQSLTFGLFALLNTSLVAIGLPERTQTGGGGLVSFASDQPLVAAGLVVLIMVALAVVTVVGRRKLIQVRQQVQEGMAILHPPARYLRALFIPSLISYLFSCGAVIVLLSAFDIPVTIWTLALALSSNALGGAVRVTPGGLGTSQAIDVIALRDYAAPEVVTAYSLSELAISAVVSLVLALTALISVSGWRGTRTLLTRLHRGDAARGLHALGERQRAIRARVRAARKRRPHPGA